MDVEVREWGRSQPWPILEIHPGKIGKENSKTDDLAGVLAGIRSRYFLMHSTSTIELNIFVRLK
jgi:hypothetical protein